MGGRWRLPNEARRSDNYPLSFDDIEFELNGANIGAAHLFDDQAARESTVFPDHFQDYGAGDQIFLNAMQSALTGSGNRVGGEKIGGASRRAQQLNQ
jgi:hypothetical protein